MKDMKLLTWNRGFDSQQWKLIFLFCEASKLQLGPNQPSRAQCASIPFSPEWSGRTL